MRIIPENPIYRYATEDPSTEEPETHNKYDWIICVLMCVAAAVVSNLGTNFQKMALNRRVQHKEGAHKCLTYVIWIIGFILIVLGSFGDFGALGFGAQSIVAPLGSLTLVVNFVLAPLMHGEKLGWVDFMWTAVIIAGCTVSVAFASHEESDFDLATLKSFYRTARFIVYFSVVVVLVVVILIAIKVIERRQKIYGNSSPEYQKFFKFHRFSYACISGIAGAQSVLFAKTCVELLMKFFKGGDFPLADWFTWVILVCMGSTIGLQIFWLNCGLARWDSLYNIPIFQSFWITVSAIGGGVFYEEFNGFSVLQWIMFPLGVCITVFGVYMLTQTAPASTTDKKSAEKISGAEETLPLLDNDVDGKRKSNLSAEAARDKINKFQSGEWTFSDDYTDYEVEFHNVDYGLDIVPTHIKAVSKEDANNTANLEVWKVGGFHHVNGEMGEAEKHGLIQPGQLLVAVNNELLLSKYLSSEEILKKIKEATIPICIRFRHFLHPNKEEIDMSELPHQPRFRSNRSLSGSNLEPINKDDSIPETQEVKGKKKKLTNIIERIPANAMKLLDGLLDVLDPINPEAVKTNEMGEAIPITATDPLANDEKEA